MQIALWLAIAVLLLIWVIWPSAGAKTPVLLLVRDGAEAVEGVARRLHGAGHLVTALDLGSSDDTPQILRRLARDGSLRVVRGGVEEVVLGSPSAVLVVRVDGDGSVKEMLAAMHLGR